MIISLSFGDFANISGLMAKKMRAKHLIVNVVLRHKKVIFCVLYFLGGVIRMIVVVVIMLYAQKAILYCFGFLIT